MISLIGVSSLMDQLTPPLVAFGNEFRIVISGIPSLSASETTIAVVSKS